MHIGRTWEALLDVQKHVLAQVAGGRGLLMLSEICREWNALISLLLHEIHIAARAPAEVSLLLPERMPHLRVLSIGRSACVDNTHVLALAMQLQQPLDRLVLAALGCAGLW